MNILVAIAIDHYQDEKIVDLKNCVSDTKLIVDLLKSRYLFDEEHVLITPKETTGDNLFSAINDIFRNALEGDNILLVYAGHGEYDHATNSAYWQPSDAKHDNRQGWYNLTELISSIKSSEALHIGLILDSCYAGAIFEEVARGGEIRPNRNLKSRYAITSGGIEKVKDGKMGGQSPFNRVIIDLLRENQKQEFSIFDLAYGVKEKFDRSYTQIPMCGGIRGSGHLGGALIFELIEKNQPLTSWFSPGYKKDDTIIDQLFDLFQFLYKEVNFVPPHVIAQHYPIRLNENQSGYVKEDYLHSPNEELVKLFASLRIINENNIEFIDPVYPNETENASEKVLFILKKLNSNLILWIDSDRQSQQVNITIPIADDKKDLLGKIDTIQFLSITREELLPDSLNPNIQKAFANYLVGNIPSAIEELLNIKTTIPNDNLLAKFVINFNLTRLRSVLWRNYYGINERPDLIAELDKIDLTEEYCTSVKSPKHSIIEWIYREYFLSKGYQSVFNLKDKIINHLKITENGGFGSNHFVWELTHNYAQFYYFIRSNYLIFEQFKEFGDITNAYIEGLIASHAVQGDNSKLEYFDDYYLDIMLHHGRAKDIREHFAKYGLKTMAIRELEENSITANKIIYLVKNYSKIATHSKKYFQDKSGTFYDRNRKLFHNALTIAAFVDFKKNQIQEIAKHLNARIIETIHRFDLDYLHLFLSRNTEKIGNELMNQLIKNMLISKSVNSDKIYQSLAYEYREHSFKLIWTEEEFDEIIKVFKKDENGRQYGLYTLIEIWKMLDDKNLKKKCESMLSDHLELNFYSGIAESCLIFGILELKDEYISGFMKDINSDINDPNQRHPFSKQENTIRSLDSFINVAYHLNLNLGDVKFKVLHGINDYYDWLLNLKNFDYTKFKTQWLNSLAITSIYYEQFSMSEELRKVIEAHLFENNDSFIETQYMDIYIHKFWNKWN